MFVENSNLKRRFLCDVTDIEQALLNLKHKTQVTHLRNEEVMDSDEVQIISDILTDIKEIQHKLNTVKDSYY